MPTAIALTYTLGGFVIAADGRARENGIVTCEKTKKIFEIKGRDFSLAYALCGRVAFGADKKENNVDLLQKTPYGITAISGGSHNDLSAYVRSLSMHLYAVVKEAQETKGFLPLSMDEEERVGDNYVVFTLFVAGYYRDHPGLYSATFCHNNQRLLEPKIEDRRLEKRPIIYGSKKIARWLFDTDDPKLAAFRVKGFQDSKQPTLSDGIEAMKNYVRACCDSEIAQLDPLVCATIGGCPHLATVTQAQGFEWIIPPKPEGDDGPVTAA